MLNLIIILKNKKITLRHKSRYTFYITIILKKTMQFTFFCGFRNTLEKSDLRWYISKNLIYFVPTIRTNMRHNFSLETKNVNYSWCYALSAFEIAYLLRKVTRFNYLKKRRQLKFKKKYFKNLFWGNYKFKCNFLMD